MTPSPLLSGGGRPGPNKTRSRHKSIFAWGCLGPRAGALVTRVTTVSLDPTRTLWSAALRTGRVSVSFPPAFAGARLLADDETPWHTAPRPKASPRHSAVSGRVWLSPASGRRRPRCCERPSQRRAAPRRDDLAPHVGTVQGEKAWRRDTQSPRALAAVGTQWGPWGVSRACRPTTHRSAWGPASQFRTPEPEA